MAVWLYWFNIFTVWIRSAYDNITVSNEAYRIINIITMTELSNETRINVLTAIDELNQLLLGNVTIESATDTARELTYQLNKEW